MKLEQLVRIILERAIEDGLVAPMENLEDPDPQSRTDEELQGCVGVLAGRVTPTVAAMARCVIPSAAIRCTLRTCSALNFALAARTASACDRIGGGFLISARTSDQRFPLSTRLTVELFTPNLSPRDCWVHPCDRNSNISSTSSGDSFARTARIAARCLSWAVRSVMSALNTNDPLGKVGSWGGGRSARGNIDLPSVRERQHRELQLVHLALEGLDGVATVPLATDANS